MRKSKILVATLAMVMCCAAGVGIAKVTNNGEATMITASAAELGEIKVGTYMGGDTWLGGSTRMIFTVPSTVSGKYSMTSGTISLTRGGQTYTLNGKDEGFSIQNIRDNYGDAAWIELWQFGKEHVLNTTYAREAGDVFVINGTFSNGTDSFTIDNAKIIVNSAANADMYVEEPFVNAGYGDYVAEWSNSWAGTYYPQMNIKTNADIPAGKYKQVNADAITLTRNGTTYNLPVGDYLTIGSDNGGVQQVDFTLWPLGNPMGETYIAQEGDVLTVAGKFSNGAVTFEIQKTVITNLVGKPKTHSVVPVYTATITDEAGKIVSTMEASHGSLLQQPETPNKEGDETAVFEGWYNGDTKWDFSKAVTGDITLTPKFISVTNLGAGYTNANGMWMGTSYYFGLQPNAIPNGAHLRPTSADCMKVTRGGVETAIGHNQRDTLYKHEDGLYKIEGWTLTDWKNLQDGDILTLEGIWTYHTNDYIEYYYIEKTQIAVANTGTQNRNGETLFYSYMVGETFNVTILNEDGSEISKSTVAPYGVVSAPETPAKETAEGYETNFLGWYNGENKWDFSAKVAGDITLQAKFETKAIEYTVAFVHPKTGMPLAQPITYTVENMSQVVFPEVPADLAMEGYTVAWDKTPADLTLGGMNVSPVYTAIEYTVAFVHPKTGMPLAQPITYTVENMGEVVFPEVPADLAMEGYTVAWDKTPADLTLGGMNVSPVYTAIEYTVTFMADGATVTTVTYTVENTEISVPAVPEKEGYTGVWEAYELTTGDITVNAVYTEIEQPEPEDSSDEPVTSEPTDDPVTSEPEDSSDEPVTSEPTDDPVTSEPTEDAEEEKGGCGSVIGGVGAALTLIAAAAIVMKKKED